MMRLFAAAAMFFCWSWPLAAQTPAPWAYPLQDPGLKPPPDDGTKRTVPGSFAAFTRAQLSDLFHAPDWFPDEHPPMPQVVAQGRKPDVRACGFCHLPNGQGRPENAGLAGLPAAYFVQQMNDFKSGRRRSALASSGPQIRMVAAATNATDAEIQAAAGYFAQLSYRPWIRVVESETAPKVQVNFGSLWAPSPGATTEPLGHRIVEIPEDLGRTESRDPKSGFVAYVPVGSIKLGESLVAAGADGRPACTFCHGPDLHGSPVAPPIAGRPAIYIFRQLFDIQTGTRSGASADLMKPVVARLTTDDMIAIAAFVASRTP